MQQEKLASERLLVMQHPVEFIASTGKMLKYPMTKKFRLLSALVVIWLLIGIIWWARKPAPLENHAEVVLDAVMSADGNALMRYAFPEEIKANNLSPAKLERVFKEIVVPRYRQLTGRTKTQVQNNVDQGVADFSGKTKFDQRVTIGADTYYWSGTDARSPVLRHVLTAWSVDFHNKHNMPYGKRSQVELVLAGLKSDEKKLREIGITSLIEVDPMAGKIILLPLEELRKKYEKAGQYYAAHPEL